MTTAIEYALMAGASYISNRPDINKFPIPNGWFELPVSHANDPATGFEASTFTNGMEIVISFAGTYDNPNNPFTNPDMQADAALGLGLWSDQLGQAADYYLQVKAGAPVGTVISFTGHSLGGGLAALMGVFFGETAFTFDQAPFAKTAQMGAKALKDYLSRVDAQGNRLYSDAKLSGLTDYIQQQQAHLSFITPIPNQDLVTNLNVQGELLSTFPYNIMDRIGAQAVIPDNTNGVDAGDLHSQALLTAYLESNKTATVSGAGQVQSLSEVTYKLTDLLKMIFDKNLFAYKTDDPDNRNFIDHLVRHEFGNAPSVTTADAMVTRFTSDLWKLAQDGGMTMNEGVWSNYSNLNNISKALTAFAMQFYYEDTANATDKTKQLFTDLSTSGEGSNGVRFDMHDVSKEVAAAMNANAHVDLTKAKGYRDFQTYIETSLLLTSEERIFIKSMLPQLRDWYIQAGAGGMTATDTFNRGAFMLGGNGQDTLTGGTKADLLVGNTGDDILKGGDGSDVLIGGAGVDTYAWNASANSGIDTILDSDKQGYLRDDTLSTGSGQAGPIVLTGGTQYGDNRVFSGKDANGTNHLYTFVTGGGNYLDGEAGNNTLYADGGGNTLFAGAGDDTLAAHGGNNYLDAGDGSNRMIATRRMRSKTNGAACTVLFGREKSEVANDHNYQPLLARRSA